MSWTRSDTFSLFAVAISVVSAATSLFQASIARRKEKAEIQAKEPIVEVFFNAPLRKWPGDWAEILMKFTIRDDYTYMLDRVDILEPAGSFIMYYHQVAIISNNGELELPKHPPPSRSHCRPDVTIGDRLIYFIIRLPPINDRTVSEIVNLEVTLHDSRNKTIKTNTYCRIVPAEFFDK